MLTQTIIRASQVEAWILATQEAKSLKGLPIVGLVLSTLPPMNVKNRATGLPSPLVQGVE